jgi:hypothetical protein
MIEPQLREAFTRWADGPNALASQDAGDVASVRDAVRAGLWAAYRAGYAQALADSESARRMVEVLTGQKKGDGA